MTRVLLASIVAIAFAGCSASPAPCAEGTRQVGELCRPLCTAASQCLPTEACLDGACVPIAGPDDAGATSDAASSDAALPDATPSPPDSGPVACERDSDCGPDRIDDSAECLAETICRVNGMRRVLRFRPICRAGTCTEEDPQVSMERCQRVTQGLKCADHPPPPWSECKPSSECASDGTEERVVSVSTCEDGDCVEQRVNETQACRVETDGHSCGEESIGPWGPCGYADECVADGMRSREVSRGVCASGQCAAQIGQEVDTVGCNRTVPNGTACAAGFCCNSQCASPSDPRSCGVCGIDCGNGRCVDQGNGAYACACSRGSECVGFGYGAATTCTLDGVCRCNCNTAGCLECPEGTCHRELFATWCGYP